MLIGLMQGIGIFYYWTWFVWPFVFVFSFINAIDTAIKEENASLSSLMFASISIINYFGRDCWWSFQLINYHR